MSDNHITGRARHLGTAEGLVRHKDDKVVDWSGPAGLYLLAPALRGYTTVVVASIDLSDQAIESGLRTELGPRTDIFGLEGEGLRLDWDDVGGGRGFNTHAEALADSGYAIV